MRQAMAVVIALAATGTLDIDGVRPGMGIAALVFVRLGLYLYEWPDEFGLYTLVCVGERLAVAEAPLFINDPQLGFYSDFHGWYCVYDRYSSE